MTETLTAAGEIAHTIEIGKATYILAAQQYEASLGQALASADYLPSKDPKRNERYTQPCTCAQILGHNTGLLSAFEIPFMTEEASLGYIKSLTRTQLAKRFPRELRPHEIDQEAITFLQETGITDSVREEMENGLRSGKLYLAAIQSEYAASTGTPES